MRRGHVVIGVVVAALFLAPPALAADLNPTSPVTASGPSPFLPGCSGHTEPGTNFRNGEVEPWIAADPVDGDLAGAWQQDRWSNGGAHGQLAAFSSDGTAWSTSFALFNRCSLFAATGNRDVAGQPGSLWDRSTDPWVSYSPNGVLHQITDSFNVTGRGFGDGSAILYARSPNNGETWSSPPIVLKQDLENTVLNDKESLTADPTNSNLVYAVWDRLVAPSESANPISTEVEIGYRGPTWFTRSTNGGSTWEQPRIILDPGEVNQTIGSQILVAPDGTLVNGFNLIYNFKNRKTPDGRFQTRGYNVAIQTSSDQGQTWSGATVAAKIVAADVTTPDGEDVRSADILPDFAVDRSGTATNGDLYAVWQDARFNGQPAIALSRSQDGGATWSVPKRIDDAGDSQAFIPSVDVSDTGQVAVSYYDFRNDDPETSAAETDYWIQHSDDGGSTWSAAEQVTDRSFDIKAAPRTTQGYFLGDYEGLTHVGSAFKLFFGVAGDAANPSDIVYSSAG